MAPLAIAVVLVLCAIPAPADIVDINFDGQRAQWADIATPGTQLRTTFFTWLQWGLTLPQYLVMLAVLSFYLLDCLYAERKDRSLLFWRSLPVSDGETVASKLLVGLVIVPLGVYLLTLVAGVLFSGILVLKDAFRLHGAGLVLWDTAGWLELQLLLLTGLLIGILWYAPVAGYLLLVSAWARRNAFLWASLPPTVLPFLEHLAFGTHYLRSLLLGRMGGIWMAIGLPEALQASFVEIGGHHLVFIPGILQHLDLRAAVTNIDLWLGLAVAGAFAVAAARIRRYRDDT